MPTTHDRAPIDLGVAGHDDVRCAVDDIEKARLIEAADIRACE
jgi:hypothetical protein